MTKRIVEVFSAGCPICDEVVRVVTELACENCDVGVHDMHASFGQSKAREYGISRLPAVVVNGKIADCCGQAAVDIAMLRSLGVWSLRRRRTGRVRLGMMREAWCAPG